MRIMKVLKILAPVPNDAYDGHGVIEGWVES